MLRSSGTGQVLGSYTVSDLSGAYHPLSPLIRLGLRNPRKKEKKRVEMVIGMQNEILDGHNRSLFKVLI